MVEPCCDLGNVFQNIQERILCTTSNFFVVPTLGSFGLEGYLLLIPKNHYLGFGELPEKILPEFNELKREIKKILKAEYGLPTTIFEHGPRVGKISSGQSIDHAHLHFIPGVDIINQWAVDLMMRLRKKGHFYRVNRVEGFERARNIMSTGNSYLYVEDLEGVERMSDQNFVRPSQYFRKMVADRIGSQKWDWKSYPDYETLEKTLERLYSSFN